MAPGTRAARGAVTVIFLLNGLLLGSWAARIPAVKERLDLGEAELGLALGLVALGALVAMPVSGWMSARGGSRRTTRFAFVFCCIACRCPRSRPSSRAAAPGRDAARRRQRLARRRDERARRRRRAPPREPDPVLLPRRFSCGALIGAGAARSPRAPIVDVRWHLLGVAAARWDRSRRVPLAAARRRGPCGRGGRAAARLAAARAVGGWRGRLLRAASCEGATADWSAVYVRESLDASARASRRSPSRPSRRR